MASKKVSKTALPAKPTMAQAFNAAQGPAVNRPQPGPGNVKETPSYFPKGTSGSKDSKPKDTRSVAQRIVEAGKPKSASSTSDTDGGSSSR